MPPEIIDPNKKKYKYYSNRDEDSKFVPRQRIKSIFATKPFMIGYGIFLTVAVIFIYSMQNGGIGNILFFSNFFGIGLKIDTTVIENPNDVDSSYVFILIENKRYKEKYIASLTTTVTLYNNNGQIISSKKANYNDEAFEDNMIKIAIEFDKSEVQKSSRYIVETSIDGKSIINKKPL